MKYQLKKGVPDFVVVDGPMEKRSYKSGEAYDEKDIPPQEKQKFEMITAIASGEKQSQDEILPSSLGLAKEKGGKK